ncbi:MAG TPA: NUDIX domain-containing protein [Candidatus Baltobacteraceae bacterium]|jgi:8-oxo-dGTP pyrophosphatase MutT (NUDIX family)|nr:NUDIX domain-containing protein [Candidatus Baltobacteraceae bacterium]
MTRFRWCPEEVPDGISVRQVYGFCFDRFGLVLLQEDAGRFNLPGGKPEAGEDPPSVLARECLEESQIIISATGYLGYQEVSDDEGKAPFAQLRLVARRFLTSIEKAPAFLNWGVDGSLQSAAAAVAATERFGLNTSAVRDSIYRD